ncbi:MAG: cysteine hydrolase [Betaproteobacteria bacterium]|nr:cysteine hydrolase [Betaproteobacteria bacterium]
MTRAAARELRIAARPRAFDFRDDDTALLLIDMQRDFLEPGGFGESLGNDVWLLARAVQPAARLLHWARARGMLVVHTRESHRPDLSDCPPAKRLRGEPSKRIGDPGPMGRILIRGEPGNAIVAALAPVDGEVQVDKPGKGAFHATQLGQVLAARGIRRLILGGVTTEVCVQTTMREANDRGYDCLLVDEATASYFPEFKRSTLEMIVAQGGIVGWVARLDDVLRS